MTAVTATSSILLAGLLSGCAADERVEENTTITLSRHDLQFVVPKGYVQAGADDLRQVISADLKRRSAESLAADFPDARPAKGTKGGKGGKGGTGVVDVPGGLSDAVLATIEKQLLTAYEAFLVDPASTNAAYPDDVAVVLLPTPLTTGTKDLTSAGLSTLQKVSSVNVADAVTKAGPAVRADYQVVVGKDDAKEDIELSYQVVLVGLDDTSSLSITVSSLDEDVARDLADTIVASLAPTTT
ncbi:hypothetical protein BH11ACT8_BH11ACT8_32880 [soil metagenome]